MVNGLAETMAVFFFFGHSTKNSMRAQRNDDILFDRLVGWG
jgi:hypothetical protein